MKAEIEKRQLGLFYSVITSEHSSLQRLWKLQATVQHHGSYFKHVTGLIEKYNLPLPEKIFTKNKEG